MQKRPQKNFKKKTHEEGAKSSTKHAKWFSIMNKTNTIERYLKSVETLSKTTILLNIGGLTMSFAYMGATKDNIVCGPIYVFTAGIIFSLLFTISEFCYFYNVRIKEAKQTLCQSFCKNKIEHIIFLLIILAVISCISGLTYSMIKFFTVCFP